MIRFLSCLRWGGGGRFDAQVNPLGVKKNGQKVFFCFNPADILKKSIWLPDALWVIVVSVSEPCGLSPEQGHCRAAFPKFYYDPSSASCQSFLYGGCGGNANNFDSVEECMNRCSGHGTQRSLDHLTHPSVSPLCLTRLSHLFLSHSFG